MVQNILVNKDSTNPGVRGIAARFEALTAASPTPPSPINNKPKISFRKLPFSSSGNQSLPGKVPPVSQPLPTIANGKETQVPERPPAFGEATEPASAPEVHHLCDGKVDVQVAENASSDKQIQEQTLQVFTDRVGELGMEKQAVEDVNATKGEIAVEEVSVHEEPSHPVPAKDVGATRGKIAVEEATVQEEPSQSITTVDVDATKGEFAIEEVSVQEELSQSITDEEEPSHSIPAEDVDAQIAVEEAAVQEEPSRSNTAEDTVPTNEGEEVTVQDEPSQSISTEDVKQRRNRRRGKNRPSQSVTVVATPP